MKKVLIRFSVETDKKEVKQLTLCSEFESTQHSSKMVSIQKNGTVYINSKENQVVKQNSSSDWERYFSVNLSFGGAYVKTTRKEMDLHFPTVYEE